MQFEAFGFMRCGWYLRAAPAQLSGDHLVADMFCLLGWELDLLVQAKATLMAREAGLEAPVGR